MYKLIIIHKNIITQSKHTSRLAMLNKMAYHRRNGGYSFVSDTQSYIDILCNMDRVRKYQSDCRLGIVSNIISGQAWLQGLWDKQEINIVEELRKLKKGKLKF